VLEAARALADQGLQVRVVAMHNPGARTRERLGAVEVFRPRYLWPEHWEILQKEGGGLPIMWESNGWTRLAIVPFMLVHAWAALQHSRGCDIIHANWTLSAALALPAKVIHRKPLVVTVQGSDLVRATRRAWIARMTRLVLRRSDQVIVLSTALRDRALALGVPANRVEIVPNGVDVDKFTPRQAGREALILFVGALSEIKGVEYLVRALPAILTRRPEYRLALVGEGPQQRELMALAESLNLAEQVEFVGPQSPGQVQAWMRRAKVLVLPSIEEGLGVVLLEALASGTPCAASQAGGIPDVITPEVGVLFPPADSDALAQAVLKIIDAEPEDYAKHSRQARHRAETHFSWRVVAARLVQIYRAVLGP
jgi:glycosyltransferase involved in cell wall biosynthesis